MKDHHLSGSRSTRSASGACVLALSGRSIAVACQVWAEAADRYVNGFSCAEGLLSERVQRTWE